MGTTRKIYTHWRRYLRGNFDLFDFFVTHQCQETSNLDIFCIGIEEIRDQAHVDQIAWEDGVLRSSIETNSREVRIVLSISSHGLSVSRFTDNLSLIVRCAKLRDGYYRISSFKEFNSKKKHQDWSLTMASLRPWKYLISTATLVSFVV